jgi:GDPmannose 4,6-dehydratase
VARIVAGKATQLSLGNLDAHRDWGHAKEYVEAMWLMLQQPEPDDYVVATGETHSVREFVAAAFECVGLDWEKYVVISPELYRPSEVQLLLGDPSKAQSQLKWRHKTAFNELVREMVYADCRALDLKVGTASS